MHVKNWILHNTFLNSYLLFSIERNMKITELPQILFPQMFDLILIFLDYYYLFIANISMFLFVEVKLSNKRNVLRFISFGLWKTCSTWLQTACRNWFFQCDDWF